MYTSTLEENGGEYTARSTDPCGILAISLIQSPKTTLYCSPSFRSISDLSQIEFVDVLVAVNPVVTPLAEQDEVVGIGPKFLARKRDDVVNVEVETIARGIADPATLACGVVPFPDGFGGVFPFGRAVE